jgi:hypothetical protein
MLVLAAACLRVSSVTAEEPKAVGTVTSVETAASAAQIASADEQTEFGGIFEDFPRWRGTSHKNAEDRLQNLSSFEPLSFRATAPLLQRKPRPRKGD